MEVLTKLLETALGPFGAIIGQLTTVLKPLIVAIPSIISATTNAIKALSNNSGGTGGGGGSGIGAVVGAIGPAVVALGALALTAGLVSHQFDKILRSVSLYNPGVVQQFVVAMNNLGATIGQAFVPLVQAATQVVRQFTGMMSSAMTALAPVIKQVAEIFSGIMVRGLEIFVGVLRSIAPLLKILADVVAMLSEALMVPITLFTQIARVLFTVAHALYELSGLGTIVRIVKTLFEALNEVLRIVTEAITIFEVIITHFIDMFVKTIMDMLGLGGVMGGLKNAVDQVIRSMYLLAIQIAKLVGATGVADALLNSVRNRTRPGETAAQSPGIKTIEQLAKDLALAAATAGGAAGAGVNSEQMFWRETLREMEEIRRNGASIRAILDRFLFGLAGAGGAGAIGGAAAAAAGAAAGPGGIPPAAPAPAGGGGGVAAGMRAVATIRAALGW